MYWNHNSAYYPWIKKKTADRHHILDVGCGDGFLVRYLDDGTKKITGIDPDQDYKDYQWWLGCDEEGSWEVVSFDY